MGVTDGMGKRANKAIAEFAAKQKAKSDMNNGKKL